MLIKIIIFPDYTAMYIFLWMDVLNKVTHDLFNPRNAETMFILKPHDFQRYRKVTAQYKNSKLFSCFLSFNLFKLGHSSH